MEDWVDLGPPPPIEYPGDPRDLPPVLRNRDWWGRVLHVLARLSPTRGWAQRQLDVRAFLAHTVVTAWALQRELIDEVAPHDQWLAVRLASHLSGLDKHLATSTAELAPGPSQWLRTRATRLRRPEI